MAARYKTVSPVNPWLRPGQRFRSSEGTPEDGEGDLTVARIVHDRMGFTHAVLRDASGREISTFADQIQFAIEVGMLSPLDVMPVSTAC